mgnify:CR=1 FL=1
MKKYNFNAGPSILPDVVLEAAAKAIIDFDGTGLSLLSISHRTPEFEAVLAEAKSLMKELLGIPDNYKIYFMGGGASTQFFHIPANFLGKKAGYVNTGVWTKKAIKEAKFYGEVEVVASSEDKNFNYIPKNFAIPEDLDYTGVFDEILNQYTISHELMQVKTTNMGSLFRLTYNLEVKDVETEKELIDKLRCRNGNLEISISHRETGSVEL